MDFVPRLNSTYGYWILPISTCLIKTFYKVTLCRTEVSKLCWFAEKINHALKTDGDKLFKDLLTNNIFSKQIVILEFEDGALFEEGTGIGIFLKLQFVE